MFLVFSFFSLVRPQHKEKKERKVVAPFVNFWVDSRFFGMQMKLPRQNGKAKAKKAVRLLMARAAVSSSRLMVVVYLPRTNNISIYLFT